jgi:hypothetical protein
MKVRANFVTLACADGMALRAARLEKLSTVFGVTYDGRVH